MVVGLGVVFRFGGCDREEAPPAAPAATAAPACPDLRFKVVFGPARLAGLRVPSETHLLTWADIRLRVRSPKTERYKGYNLRASRHWKRLRYWNQSFACRIAEPAASN